MGEGIRRKRVEETESKRKKGDIKKAKSVRCFIFIKKTDDMDLLAGYYVVAETEAAHN